MELSDIFWVGLRRLTCRGTVEGILLMLLRSQGNGNFITTRITDFNLYIIFTAWTPSLSDDKILDGTTTFYFPSKEFQVPLGVSSKDRVQRA